MLSRGVSRTRTAPISPRVVDSLFLVYNAVLAELPNFA